eukprot:GHVT01077921.1.p1 GENE.GHVT01077921.1~~GHVT01077921.1.p1  ORF type:complete len:511 (-),score=77.80 GHVT01077921.1:447-1979(-)
MGATEWPVCAARTVGVLPLNEVTEPYEGGFFPRVAFQLVRANELTPDALLKVLRLVVRRIADPSQKRLAVSSGAATASVLVAFRFCRDLNGEEDVTVQPEWHGVPEPQKLSRRILWNALQLLAGLALCAEGRTVLLKQAPLGFFREITRLLEPDTSNADLSIIHAATHFVLDLVRHPSARTALLDDGHVCPALCKLVALPSATRSTVGYSVISQALDVLNLLCVDPRALQHCADPKVLLAIVEIASSSTSVEAQAAALRLLRLLAVWPRSRPGVLAAGASQIAMDVVRPTSASPVSHRHLAIVILSGLSTADAGTRLIELHPDFFDLVREVADDHDAASRPFLIHLCRCVAAAPSHRRALVKVLLDVPETLAEFVGFPAMPLLVDALWDARTRQETDQKLAVILTAILHLLRPFPTTANESAETGGLSAAQYLFGTAASILQLLAQLVTTQKGSTETDKVPGALAAAALRCFLVDGATATPCAENLEAFAAKTPAALRSLVEHGLLTDNQ